MGRWSNARRIYAEAVEYLCCNSDALQARIPRSVWDPSFATINDGDPDSSEWRDAVRTLHDAAESAGVPGGIGLRTTMGAHGWPAGPPDRSTGWVCPTDRCTRVELRTAPDQPEPRCALAGQPMRFVAG